MNRSIFWLMIVLFPLFGSCSEETLVDTGDGSGVTTLSLNFPLTRASVDPEGSMRSLRLLIFATNTMGYEEGEMLVNELIYDGRDGEKNEIAFIKTVPVGYLNIYLIANETADMALPGITTVASLKSVVVDYDKSKALEYLKPPFPMFSEYRAVKIDKDGHISHSGAVQVAGKTTFPIERTIAKLTLNIDCDFSDLPYGEKIALSEVYVEHNPLRPGLIPNAYIINDVVADCFTSDKFSLTESSGNLLLKAGDVGFTTKVGGISFYIPEHIIDDADRSFYTYLRIEGYVIRNPGIKVSYKVPLGNGLGAVREGTVFDAAYLATNYKKVSSADLTVTRNMHYTLDVKIKSFGELDGMQILPTIKPWIPVDVDGSSNEPYLNVSTVTATVSDLLMSRIYFWTNQKTIFVNSMGKLEDGTEMEVNTLFSKLAGNGADNLHFDPNTGNGYIDIVSAATAYGSKYTIYLTTGNLMREIDIVSTNDLIAPHPWSLYKWVGTFHKASQTGERVIYADHTKEWSAEVVDELEDFIVLDGPGFIYDPKLKTDQAGNAENYQLQSHLKKVSGVGRIFFRVGMKSKLNGGDPNAVPRYGRIKLSWIDGSTPKIDYIYVRQGEAADYIMRPGDTNGSGNGVVDNRSYARKYSIYNVSLTPNTFVDFPTKVGGYYQWNRTTPYQLISGKLTGYTLQTGNETSWSDSRETCPPGYRHPADNALMVISGSELRQSLLLNPVDYSTQFGIDNNLVQGWYADGYFDRLKTRECITQNATEGKVYTYDNTRVGELENQAFSGTLYYNPFNNASNFFPSGGALMDTSPQINMWMGGITYTATKSLRAGNPKAPILLEGRLVYVPTTTGYVNAFSGLVNVRCIK